MAKLEVLLGLGSVSARVFKFGLRIHGHTLGHFAAFIALNDLRLNKQIELLISAISETRSRGAIGIGWKSISKLERAINRVPASERDSALSHLEMYAQMLLQRSNDLGNKTDLELLAVEVIEKFRSLRLKEVAKRALKRTSPAGIVIDQWQAAIDQAGGDLLTIFKRFKAVVSLGSLSLGPPAIANAGAYIRNNADSIWQAVQTAKAGKKADLLGHLSNVRGYLGEAYALLSPVWRRTHRRALQEAKAAAKRMGPDYEVLSLSQLENNIRTNINYRLKEGPDQMIVIINRKRKEAITFLSAQVKTANTSEAVDQTIEDAMKRTAGWLEFIYKDEPFALKLVLHERVTAKRYVLNAAESRIPASDLVRLEKAGIKVSELILDMSVSQFSHLAVSMIEEGLNVVKKVKALAD